MNEANTWEFLRDVALPLGHYDRIESPDTAPGHPDVRYTVKGHSGTIELKYAKGIDPPFPADPDKGGLRTSQLKWFRDEIRAGGTCWIIAELPPKTTGVSGYIVVLKGIFAPQFNGMPYQDLLRHSSGILDRAQPEAAAKCLEGLLTNG